MAGYPAGVVAGRDAHLFLHSLCQLVPMSLFLFFLVYRTQEFAIA